MVIVRILASMPESKVWPNDGRCLAQILTVGLSRQEELRPLGAWAEKFPKDTLRCRPASSPSGTSQVTSCGVSRPLRRISAVCAWAVAALSVSSLFLVEITPMAK